MPDAPAASCAKVESTRVSHHRFTGTPGLPCAMVLTAYSVLSPVTGLSCHRRLRIWHAKARSGLMHLRKLDASVGASGPHDFAVRISAVRLRAGRPLTGPIRTRPASPFARRRCRVHRIPPRVRDDREPPLWGRDGRVYRSDFSSGGSGIFFASGLDTDLLICPAGSLQRPSRIQCGTTQRRSVHRVEMFISTGASNRREPVKFSL